VNNKYSSFKRRIFSDKNDFLGGVGVAVAHTPCRDITVSWRGILWPYYPKHRVPGYPFKYPTGTRVQKHPKVRALVRVRDIVVSNGVKFTSGVVSTVHCCDKISPKFRSTR